MTSSTTLLLNRKVLKNSKWKIQLAQCAQTEANISQNKSKNQQLTQLSDIFLGYHVTQNNNFTENTNNQ